MNVADGSAATAKKSKGMLKFLSKRSARIYRYGRCYYYASVVSINKPNMVFVWIPKTAGTSLSAALEREVGMINLGWSLRHVKAFRNRGAVTFSHIDYQCLLRQGLVSKSFDQSAFKFTVVRDPYDRALSLYYYLKRTRRISGELVEFLAEVQKNRPPIGIYNYLGISQANPQVDWITDDNGEFFVDKIYRFENMEQLRDDFRQMLQLPDLDIGHVNRTERDLSMNEALLAHSEIVPLIEEIYARDFDMLNYERRYSSN